MLTPPDILFVNYIVKRDNSSVIISIKKWIPYMYLIGAAAFIVKQCNCVVYRSSTGAIRVDSLHKDQGVLNCIYYHHAYICYNTWY